MPLQQFDKPKVTIDLDEYNTLKNDLKRFQTSDTELTLLYHQELLGRIMFDAYSSRPIGANDILAKYLQERNLVFKTLEGTLIGHYPITGPILILTPKP